jgi:hypothetical protein
MTKRELLELAAKAAGLLFDPTRHDPKGLWVVRTGAICQGDQVLWNPLTSNADAKILALQFGIPGVRPWLDLTAEDRHQILTTVAQIGREMP